MLRPGSLVRSIAAPILAAVIVAGLFGALTLGWSLNRAVEDGLRREITLDAAAIRQNEARLRVVAVADAIDHRIAAAPATSGGLYLLADRDGVAITGNLARVPNGRVVGDWISFTAKTADGETARWLGRREALAQDFTLFVARRADLHWVVVRQAAPAVAGIILVCLALIGVVLSHTSRRVAAAVSNLNAVIAAARSGAPNQRLTMEGQSREVMDLGAQINVLLDTIDRQIATMRRLSTQAAHELSTPLARVVTRLRHGADPATVAQCREDLEDALAVLKALLDLAEHEAEPGVAGQALDLAAVCASVCDMYADVAADRAVVLRRDLAPAPVRGEPALLTRAAANLLDNALKASPPGSAVVVSTGIEATSAFLSVADEGGGVEGCTLEDLMIAARAEPRAPGSHGLGLRFTRAIALRHGAALTLAPGPARGSVFKLAFPAIPL